MSAEILVTSHVGRDFLQNAAYFNSLSKVIWEYISNSIDAARDGVLANVVVSVRQQQIVIEDNGEGMNRDDFNRFFQMHGENAQRLRGKRVRGKFGTGKSAAFGIARELEIESIKGGRRNVVCLSVEDIQSARGGKPFPVHVLVENQPSDEPTGTTVTIRRLNDVPTDIEKAIRYVEKQLARMRVRATVIINDHRCEFREPPSVHEWPVTPPPDVRNILGDITMTIKASPTPLSRDDVGIDVLANGIWHETTLAEVAGDQTNRVFGFVDVPCLDDDSNFDVPAYDNTRNGTLNRAHPAVHALLYWIQEEVKRVQKILQDEARQRRESEEAKRLEQHAKDIAQVLNEDFREAIAELDQLRQIAGRRRRTVSESGIGDTVLPGNGDEKSDLIQTGQAHGNGKRGNAPPAPGEVDRPGPGLKEGESRGSSGSITNQAGRRRSQGLFSLEFAHETEGERRSHYDTESRTIYVNLDHPQIAAALRLGDSSVNSPQFRLMAFDVAVVEYAQALQFERVSSGESFDAADAVYSIGEIIDRVTRRIAAIAGSA